MQSREQWIRLQETNVNIIWCKYLQMDIKPCVLYCQMDYEVELKGFIVVKCFDDDRLSGLCFSLLNISFSIRPTVGVNKETDMTSSVRNLI